MEAKQGADDLRLFPAGMLQSVDQVENTFGFGDPSNEQNQRFIALHLQVSPHRPASTVRLRRRGLDAPRQDDVARGGKNLFRQLAQCRRAFEQLRALIKNQIETLDRRAHSAAVRSEEHTSELQSQSNL